MSRPARHLLTWAEAYDAGAGRCGGKGFNLARLARYGFTVPRGGVLSAETYDALMAVPDVAEAVGAVSALSADTAAGPLAATPLERVRRAIESWRLPAERLSEIETFLDERQLLPAAVAVRSSAVGEDGASASFSGMHESVLNVRGLAAIEAAILQCYASLWTPRAVAYRRRLGLADADVRCAVVLMAMVQAEGRDEPASAGVAFSCDPRTGRRHVVVINAAAGMGDKVVQGGVNPEQYTVSTQRGAYRIEEARGALTEAQQLDLARTVWRIHWALGEGQEPQDVEWAHDGRRLWIVQARPVTRLPRHALDGCRHMPVYWSTANIKDAVPGVVSMGAWSMIVEAIDVVLYASPEAAGIQFPPGLETVRRFDGRAYFDLTELQWVMYDGLGVRPHEVAASIGGHQPEIPVPGNPFTGSDGRRRRQNGLRLLSTLLGVPRRLRREGDRHIAQMKQLAAIDFEPLSDAKLLEWFSAVERDTIPINLLIGLANTYAGPWQNVLEALLRPVAGDDTGSILSRLLAGGGQVTSAEHGYRLHDLAEIARADEAARAWLEAGRPADEWTALPADSPFRREFARFLDEFGHRGVYEADILNPRWIEDPGYLLNQVRAHLKAGPRESPRAMAERVRREGEAALAAKTLWRRPIIHWVVRRLQEGVALREYAKSVLVAIIWPVRRASLEIGRRMTERGLLDRPEQVFHLAKIDLLCLMRGEWDGRGARELARDRAARRDAWLAEPSPPDVIIEGGPSATQGEPAAAPDDGRAEEALGAQSVDQWTGIGVSGGRATGPACVIRHPDEEEALRHGDVLVAPSTDPGWTPLFLRASAIVMESGGFLSHGANVAREFGLPAVVNIPGILAKLTDGDAVTVDGDAARVMRLRPGARDTSG
jgi:pyruvate,water dikinase